MMPLDVQLAEQISGLRQQWRRLFHRGIVVQRFFFTGSGDVPPFVYTVKALTPNSGTVTVENVQQIAPQYRCWDASNQRFTSQIPVYNSSGTVIGHTGSIVVAYEKDDPVWLFAPRGSLDSDVFILSDRYELEELYT